MNTTPITGQQKLLCGIAALALMVGAARNAHADVIPYPNVGTPNPVTYHFTAANTGDIVAYFAGSGAGYSESVGMLDNGVLTSSGFGLNDHTSFIGQSFNLGHVTRGDTLTFDLDIEVPAEGNVYSNPALNVGYDVNGTDGHNHIYSVPYTATSPIIAPDIPAGTYVAFEDLAFPYSDFNYFDETYVFTNVATALTNVAAAAQGVPEPASLALFGLGLLGIAAVRRTTNAGSL
jgi:hypothetical protein